MICALKKKKAVQAICVLVSSSLLFGMPLPVQATQNPNKLAPKSSFSIKESKESINIPELLSLLGVFMEKNAQRMKVGDLVFFDGEPVRIVRVTEPSESADLETPFLEFQDEKTQKHTVFRVGDFEMLARLSFLPDGAVQTGADRWIDKVESITCLLDHHDHAAAIGVLDRAGRIPLVGVIQEEQVFPRVLYDLDHQEVREVRAMRDKVVEWDEDSVPLEDLKHHVFLKEKAKGLTFENIDLESEIARCNTLFEEAALRLGDTKSPAQREYELREIRQQARLCKTLLFLQQVGIFSKTVVFDETCGKIVAITPRYDSKKATLMFEASFRPTFAKERIIRKTVDADFLEHIRFVQSGLSQFYAERLEDYDMDAEIFRLKLLERQRHTQSPWENFSPETFLDYLKRWLPHKTLSGLTDKPLSILGVSNVALRSPEEITLALKVVDPSSGKRESLVISVGVFEMLKAVLRWKLKQEPQPRGSQQGPIGPAAATAPRPIAQEPILDASGNIQVHRRDVIAGEFQNDPQLAPLFTELQVLYDQEYPSTGVDAGLYREWVNNMKFSLRHPWLITRLFFRGSKVFFREGYFTKDIMDHGASIREQWKQARQQYQAWRRDIPIAGQTPPVPENITHTTQVAVPPTAPPNKEVDVEEALLRFAEQHVYPTKMAEEELLKVMFFHLAQMAGPFVSEEQRAMLQYMKNLYWQGEILSAKDRVKQRLLGKEREMGRLRFLMPLSEDLTSQVLVRRILDYGPERLMQDIRAGRLDPSTASQVWEFLEAYRRVLLNPDLADSFAHAQKISEEYSRDAWNRLFPFLQLLRERMLQQKLTKEEEDIVDYLAALARERLGDDKFNDEAAYARSLRDLFLGIGYRSAGPISDQAMEQAGQRLAVLEGYAEAQGEDLADRMGRVMEWVRQAPLPMRVAMAVCLGMHAGVSLSEGTGAAMSLCYDLLHPDTVPGPTDLRAAFNGFDGMKDLLAKNIQSSKKSMQAATGDAVGEAMRKAVQKEKVDLAVQKAKAALRQDAQGGPSAQIQKAVKEFLEKSGAKMASKKEAPVPVVGDAQRLTALRAMFGDMLGQAKKLFDKDIAAGRYKGKVTDSKLKEFSGWMAKAHAEAGKILDAMVARMTPVEKARFLENQVMPVYSFQAWGANGVDELARTYSPTQKQIALNLNGNYETYENFLSALIHAHFHTDIEKPDAGNRLHEGVDQIYVKGVLSLLGIDYHNDFSYSAFTVVAGLFWNEDRDALMAWAMGKTSGEEFGDCMGKKIFSGMPPKTVQKVKDFLRGKGWNASAFVKLVGPHVKWENLKSNPGKIDLTHRMLLTEFLSKEGFLQGSEIYALLVEGFAPALKEKLVQGQKLSPSTVNMFFHLLSLAAQGRSPQEQTVLRNLADELIRMGVTPPPDFDKETLAIGKKPETVQPEEKALMARQQGPGAEAVPRDLLGAQPPPAFDPTDMEQQLNQLGSEPEALKNIDNMTLDVEQENRIPQAALDAVQKPQEQPIPSPKGDLASAFGIKTRQLGTPERVSDVDLGHLVEKAMKDVAHAGKDVMNLMPPGKGLEPNTRIQMTQGALNLAAEEAIRSLEAAILGGEVGEGSREKRALLAGLKTIQAVDPETKNPVSLSWEMQGHIDAALWAAMTPQERLTVLKDGRHMDWTKQLEMLITRALRPIQATLGEIPPEERKAILEPLVARAVAELIEEAEQFLRNEAWNRTRFLDLVMAILASSRFHLAETVYGFALPSSRYEEAWQSMPFRLFHKVFQDHMHRYDVRGKEYKDMQEIFEALIDMPLEESIKRDFMIAQLSAGADIADVRNVFTLMHVLEKFQDVSSVQAVLQKMAEVLINALDKQSLEELIRLDFEFMDKKLMVECLEIGGRFKHEPLFTMHYWEALDAWAQKLPVGKRVQILNRLDRWYRSGYHHKENERVLETAFRRNYQILMDSIGEATDPWDLFCLYDLVSKPPNGVSVARYRASIEAKLSKGEIAIDLATLTNFFARIFDEYIRPSEIPNNPLAMQPSNLLPGFLTPEVWKRIEPFIEQIPWHRVCYFDRPSEHVTSWLQQYASADRGAQRFRHPFLKLDSSQASVLTHAIADQLIDAIRTGRNLIPPSERPRHSVTQHDHQLAMKNAFDLLVVLMSREDAQGPPSDLTSRVAETYSSFLAHGPDYPDFSSIASGFPLFQRPELVQQILPGWQTMLEKAPANPNMKAVVLTSLAKFPQGSEQVAGSVASIADRAIETMSVEDFVWVAAEVHRWVKAGTIVDEKRLAAFLRAAVRKINGCMVPPETPSDRFIAGGPREIALHKINALIGFLPAVAIHVRDTQQKMEIASILAGMDSKGLESKTIVLENKVVRQWLQFLASTDLSSRPDIAQKIVSIVDSALPRLLDIIPEYWRESFTDDLPRLALNPLTAKIFPHALGVRVVSKLAEIAQDKSFLEDCDRGGSDQRHLLWYLQQNALFFTWKGNTPQTQKMVAKTIAATLLFKFKGEFKETANKFIQDALSKNILAETLLNALARLDYRWNYNADLGAKVMDHLVLRLEGKTLTAEELYPLSKLIWLMKDKARALTLLERGFQACKNTPGWEQRFLEKAKLDQLAIRIDETGAESKDGVEQRIRKRCLLGSPVLEEVVNGLPASFTQGGGKKVIDDLRRADLQLVLASLDVKDLEVAQDRVKAIKTHWEEVSKGFLEKFKDKPPTLGDTREMMELLFRFSEGFKTASLSMAEERALAMDLAKSAADFISLMDPAKRIEFVLGYFRPEFKDGNRNHPLPGSSYVDILMAKDTPEAALQRQYTLALLGSVASSLLGGKSGEYKTMSYDELLGKLLEFQRYTVELDGFAAGISPAIGQEVETAPMEAWRRNLLRLKLFYYAVHFEKGTGALEMLKNWPPDFSLKDVPEEALVESLREFEDAKQELFDYLHRMGVLSSVLPKMEDAQGRESDAIKKIRSTIGLIREIFNAVPSMHVEDRRYEARPIDYVVPPSAVPVEGARVQGERDFLKHFNDVMGAKISGAKVAKDWSPIGTRYKGMPEKQLGVVSKDWSESPAGTLAPIRQTLARDFPEIRTLLEGPAAPNIQIWEGMTRLGENTNAGSIRIDTANFQYTLGDRTYRSNLLPLLTLLHELLHDKIKTGDPDVDEVAIEAIVLGYLFTAHGQEILELLEFLKVSPLIQHKKYAKMIRRLQQWGTKDLFGDKYIRRVAQTILRFRDPSPNFLSRVDLAIFGLHPIHAFQKIQRAILKHPMSDARRRAMLLCWPKYEDAIRSVGGIPVHLNASSWIQMDSASQRKFFVDQGAMLQQAGVILITGNFYQSWRLARALQKIEPQIGRNLSGKVYFAQDLIRKRAPRAFAKIIFDRRLDEAPLVRWLRFQEALENVEVDWDETKRIAQLHVKFGGEDLLHEGPTLRPTSYLSIFKKTVHISSLYLVPQYKNLGIGRRIVQEIRRRYPRAQGYEIIVRTVRTRASMQFWLSRLKEGLVDKVLYGHGQLGPSMDLWGDQERLIGDAA